MHEKIATAIAKAVLKRRSLWKGLGDREPWTLGDFPFFGEAMTRLYICCYI